MLERICRVRRVGVKLSIQRFRLSGRLIQLVQLAGERSSRFGDLTPLRFDQLEGPRQGSSARERPVSERDEQGDDGAHEHECQKQPRQSDLRTASQRSVRCAPSRDRGQRPPAWRQ